MKSLSRFAIPALKLAVLSAAAFAVIDARAVVIGFEGEPMTIYGNPDPRHFFFPVNFYKEQGYTFTNLFDFGTIGPNESLGDLAPRGNSSQYYTVANGNTLSMTAPERLVDTPYGQEYRSVNFNLNSFDLAFYSPTASQYGGQLSLQTFKDDSYITLKTDVLADADGAYSFSLQTDPLFAAAVSNVNFLSFSICGYDAAGQCTDTSAGFSIDNVDVTPAVPEASTWSLLGLGAAAMALFGKFRAAADRSGRRSPAPRTAGVSSATA